MKGGGYVAVPPLVGEVSANFSAYRVSRGQRGGSLRTKIPVS
jgi:hypothetical protein